MVAILRSRRDSAWFVPNDYHNRLSWLAMRVITALDLRKSLGAFLDQASAGERFVIERDHRPLAMLVSVEDGHRLDDDVEARRARTIAALDRLAELGARIRDRVPNAPDAVTAIRLERDRDDPGFVDRE